MNNDLIQKIIAHHTMWAAEISEIDLKESKFHEDAANELSTLAQQGSAGGIPAAYVSMRQLLGVRDSENGSQPRSVMLSRESTRNRRVALYTAISQAGVTDEMAERAYRHWNYERWRAALGIEGSIDDGLGMMKRAIAAALAPQPEDAT